MHLFMLKGIKGNEEINIAKANDITFREGCEKYLDDCRVRNLREGTIGHYRQSYVQFYKYFDPDMILFVKILLLSAFVCYNHSCNWRLILIYRIRLITSISFRQGMVL